MDTKLTETVNNIKKLGVKDIGFDWSPNDNCYLNVLCRNGFHQGMVLTRGQALFVLNELLKEE